MADRSAGGGDDLEGVQPREDEVGRLFDEHAARAFSYARARGLSHADADDVVAESFLRAFLSRGSFRGEARFATWLFTIVRNQAVDVMRAESRRARHETAAGSRKGPPPDGPERSARGKERHAAVAGALAALAAEDRAALSLVTAGGLSYREAAEVEGISLSALASRVFRARRGLRRHLSQRGVVEA